MTEFVRVGTVGDLADGGIMLVTAGGEEVVLVRVGDGYHAIAPMCSHAFGPLLGTIYGHEIECPIHQGRFDLRNGAPTRDPAEEPIATYAVRVEGDAILVGPKTGAPSPDI